jgi:hypothetical protein
MAKYVETQLVQKLRSIIFFLICLLGGGVQLGSLGTVATDWPIVPALGDYDDGEFCGMKSGRGNRSTRRKPAPAPLCPSQIPLDQTRDGTRTAAVGSQRLTT